MVNYSAKIGIVLRILSIAAILLAGASTIDRLRRGMVWDAIYSILVFVIVITIVPPVCMWALPKLYPFFNRNR